MYFFKALVLMVSFILSISRGGDEPHLDCTDPQVRDEGMAVSIFWEGESFFTRLFSVNIAGEEELDSYPCFEVDRSKEELFEGNLVLMDCFRPQSWDMGYDILLVKDRHTGHPLAYVHELSFLGPQLKGKLACVGDWY